MYNLKDMVKDNKQVKFTFYRQGELFYETECGFEFPVPISDTGNGVFRNEDKAILFMRYIRKHIASIEEAKKESTISRASDGKPYDPTDERITTYIFD